MSETLLILDASTDASDVGPEYNEEEGGEDVMRCKVADVSQVVSSTDGVRAMDGGVLVGTNSCSRSSNENSYRSNICVVDSSRCED